MKNNKLIGSYIAQFETIDSTNKYMLQQLLLKEITEGTIIISSEQTNGKGQIGNSWESEKGKNILFSLLLSPDFINASSQFLLNKVISISVAEFIMEFTSDVFIKWPNDIYVGNKKIAGILIENRILGDTIQNSIIGIGININQEIFLSNAPNPISLKNITNDEYNIDECMELLCMFIEKWYDLLKDNNLNFINKTYLDFLKNYNVFSKYLYNEKIIIAKITGVSEYGMLKLQINDGSNIECDMKEIIFLF